ncbi:MAG: hypothetical protein WCF90_03650 [Methanomicrobiales archaeon]
MSRIHSGNTTSVLAGMLLIAQLILPFHAAAGTARFDIKSNPYGA